jgi:hypothetical protein
MNTQAYESKLQDLKNSAIEFGKTLIAWRRMNGWTQYTIGKWAEDADFVYPSNCNVSTFENGKNLHPRPITFMQYAELNLRLANLTREDLLKIKDQSVRQIIEKSKPLEESCIWCVEHFFLHFIGVIPRPMILETFMGPSPSLQFNSKEEAFMKLSPGRFSIKDGFILIPSKMTNSEALIIDFLCAKHGYKAGTVKWR